MTFTFLMQNLINALQWGSFYALIALGYSMVYSILMLFNFAHGDIFMVGAYIGLMLTLHQFVMRTKWGMAMRAMAFDYVVVPLLGVPMNTIAAMTFAIGSALAVAAGILFGLAYPVLDPYMGISFGWKAFVAAILEGRGSIMGACIAELMLGFIEIMTVPAIQIINRLLSMNIGSNLRDLIAYSIVLIILIFQPHGLFGQAYSAKLRL